jgi:hypothetical protein
MDSGHSEESPSMQFRLSTLLLLFVLLWSSLAVFGPPGIIVFTLLVASAIGIARSWALLFALLGILMLVALLLPCISAAREAARKCCCNCNLKQLALALHVYNEANGCFPPAYIADRNGRPMHSWRVLILPYIESSPLYQQYNFNEPWDGPNNKKLLAARPTWLACPSDHDAYRSSATCTSYVAVVGANAAWTGGKPKKVADLGPTSNTIMLAEVTGASIAWTEPRDFNIDLPQTSPQVVTASSKHPAESDFFHYAGKNGVQVALGDASIRLLPGELLDATKYPNLFRVGGFKEKDVDDAYSASRPIHWPNCAALAVWILTVALILSRAVQARRKLIADSRAGQGTTDAEQAVASSSP